MHSLISEHSNTELNHAHLNIHSPQIFSSFHILLHSSYNLPVYKEKRAKRSESGYHNDLTARPSTMINTAGTAMRDTLDQMAEEGDDVAGFVVA